VVSPEPQRREPRRPTFAQHPPETGPPPWSGRLRRGKLLRLELPASVLPRPRLMARIDDGRSSLTLIVAPAGFGKTTVAAEWASQEPYAAWLTADAADASLLRFWAHLRAAIGDVTPSFGELVDAALEVPHRAPAVDLGRMLADELLDAAMPQRLVIDDFHLVPASETHAFLDGLLEIAPPGFHVVITARHEPPLDLTRLRLRGAIRELRGDDLLFTAEETKLLVAGASPGGREDAEQYAAALWQRTHGWAVGLHLAAITAPGATAAAVPNASAAAEQRLLDALLDETLASRSPGERSALVRSALPEAFVTPLVAALAGGDEAGAAAEDATRFALAADLCRPSPRYGGDWLEYHSLFREAMLRRLEREETPHTLASLHARAAAWFEAAALPDAAIGHWLTAGEVDTAVALVEREIQPAFDREDWPTVTRWLTLLPEETIHKHLSLLLAKGWIAHLRGRSLRLMEIVRLIEEHLAGANVPEAVRTVARAEVDLMQHGTLLPIQIDPERARATLQAVIDHVPPVRRFQFGLAWTLYGMALQATGQRSEAIEQLARLAEAETERLDAGSTRMLFGLLFVHWQAGNLGRVQRLARTTHEMASRHRLQQSASWGHRFLGDVLYERNDLEGAIGQYAIVARHYEYFHLTGLREALFGLALAHHAAGRTPEGWQVLRRSREIMLDAVALEHVPVLEAYEAYLSLLSGDLPRAVAWARECDINVDSAPLYFVIHPSVIRASILCATGDAASLDEATALLEEVRQRAARAHFTGALVRIEALLAVAHVKRGLHDAAVVAMGRSLATGGPQNYIRTYLDLLPWFTPELRQLAPEVALPATLRAALEAPPVPSTHLVFTPRRQLVETLTARERDVLAALAERLSYKEIADRLFIAPATVKRHASRIYHKLGVAGRNEAIRVARELDWLP
jgi:LuxR family transcriptional regulator, maltose regulon positive regulatory protein